MVGIVVNYSDTADLTFFLKAPVCAAKFQQTLLHDIHRDLQEIRHRKSGQGIGNIVGTGNRELEMTDRISMLYQVKSAVSCAIIRDVPGLVITAFTVGEDLAGKIMSDLLIIFNFTADNKRAVLRKPFRK